MGLASPPSILSLIWSVTRPYVIGTIAVVGIYAIAAAVYGVGR